MVESWTMRRSYCDRLQLLNCSGTAVLGLVDEKHGEEIDGTARNVAAATGECFILDIHQQL